MLRRYSRERSEDAFRELVRRYGALVYGACLHHVRRAELAEDASQAVFLVLARRAGQIRVKTSLAPWLLGTSKLVCRGLLNKERRRQRLEGPLPETLAAVEPEPDSQLFAALERLRSAEREAIVLRFVQGLSLGEIGRAQGISQDAARMRVQRALDRLRERFVPVQTTLPAPVLERILHHASTSSRVHALTQRALISMTYSAPLYTACTAIALIAVSTRLVHPGPAAHPPSLRPALSQTRPAATATQRPPDPPGSLGAGFTVPTLSHPFTLIYRFTVTDLSSPKERHYRLEQTEKDVQKRLDSDQISPDQARKLISDASTPEPDYNSAMTLSYDGRTLVMKESDPEHPGESRVGLTDGTYTYSLHEGPNNGRYGLGRWSGVNNDSGWLVHLPVIGISLPELPLVFNGRIFVPKGVGGLHMGTGSNHLCYSDGEIDYGSQHAVRKVYLGRPKALAAELYVLSHPRSFEGYELAGTIELIERNGNKAEPDFGQVESRTVYTLVQATNQALSPEQFVPETYLQEGATFSEGLPDGRQRVIQFSRSKGTLDQQLAQAAPIR